MNKIVIGVDQSYQDTGISIAYNGVLKASKSVYLKNLKSNTLKRQKLLGELNRALETVSEMQFRYNAEAVVIIERIRLRSQGFLNIDYIKSIGALNALIVDTADCRYLPVYSVDTRAWKTAVVGTAKPKDNPYGIDPHKWPTILWCVKQGYKNKILKEVSARQKKGVIEKNGERYTYNDNIADSICIALYGFTKNQKLQEEH